MDILLYNPDNTHVSYSGQDAEGTIPAKLSGRTATRTEAIANKVVKFLLTPIGSDALDREYGSYIATYTQIAENEIPRLYIELQGDINRCLSFIKAVERDLDDGIEKLESMRIETLKYAPENIRGMLLIRIVIMTTFSNDALVNIPIGS